MAVSPYTRQARGIFIGTYGVDVTAGDLMYFDGTNWVKADATDNTKFAEAIATNSFASGDVGTLCTACVIVDEDAPYTQGATQYLSATAGAITETRPTGAENLVQAVGYALSTSELHAEIQIPKEVTINLSPMTDGAAVFSQRNDFTGVLLGAAAEAAGYTFMVPQNMVGNVVEYLWWSGVGTILDASDTYTVDVSGGIDDETNAATSDGITAAALTVAADDLNKVDISAAFDAAGLMAPGNIVGIDIDKAAEGSAGDDPLMLGCQVIVLVV